VFDREVGHIECKFQEEWGGVAQRQLLASENWSPWAIISHGVICVILSLAILTIPVCDRQIDRHIERHTTTANIRASQRRPGKKWVT